MKVTNIEELNEAIRQGHYDVGYVKSRYLREGTVIDENKSVKWNREEVERLNNEMKEKVEMNRKKRRDVERKQTEDIIRAYANDNGLTEEQVGKIYEHAYRESHSEGRYAVLDTLEELIDLIVDVGVK